MTHVVTQSCCADASCVYACPVNCIHPAPGEPGFGTTEMLYVDPDACVDCGACTTACPAGAITSHHQLGVDQLPFIELNRRYYQEHPHADRTPLAKTAGVTSRSPRLARQVRVAIVGAGPAGLYAADELLRHPGISVDVLDRLPTPHGLLRSGVAPDHHRTKGVARLFSAIERQPGFTYLLDVEVGRDLSHEELVAHYDAVVYATGARGTKPLGVPGEDARGVVDATAVAAWANGHPDQRDLDVPLDTERAVIVGNGNVALDLARLLTLDPGALAHTDIAALPLVTLGRSEVREVVLLGRRGPGAAAFTLPELIGLAGLQRQGIDVVTDAEMGQGGELLGDPRGEILDEFASRRPTPGRRRIVLRFQAPVSEIMHASGRVVGVRLGDEILATGLVVRAVGSRVEPVGGLPVDPAANRVAHLEGRVLGHDGAPIPGLYVAGWAKRGPQGFLGTNKSCAQETVRALLSDLPQLPAPTPGIHELLRRRRPDLVDNDGWQRIDDAELRRGTAHRRPRLKIVDRDELLRVAHARRAGPGGPRVD